MINAIGTPACTFKQLWVNVSALQRPAEELEGAARCKVLQRRTAAPIWAALYSGAWIQPSGGEGEIQTTLYCRTLGLVLLGNMNFLERKI